MAAKHLAVALCLVACAAACTGADQEASQLPAFSPPPSAAPQPGTSEVSDTERIAAAYQAYTAAVSEALASGDADLEAIERTATAQALEDARARVKANADDGVVTSGALEPSATAAEVIWSGGDRASISDCVLNGLAHVEDDAEDTVVTEADGTRRPVEAELSLVSNGWVVTRVEMPQDPDSDNPQKDPPFLRGPMPDGPPSCAPPELEHELLDRYQAFWDAFDRAFGFGRDGPANPDDPALAETSVDPQLADSREFFAELRKNNQTSRGEPDRRAPWVLAVTDFDRTALIADCVVLSNSQTVSLNNGDVVAENNEGQLNYEESRMSFVGRSWKVQNSDVRAEAVNECEPPS